MTKTPQPNAGNGAPNGTGFPKRISLDDWDPLEEETGDAADDDIEQDAHYQAVNAKVLQLRSLYVETSRDAILANQFDRLLEERDSNIDPRRWSGLLVRGHSGAGKTRMLRRFLSTHPRVRGYGTEDSNFAAIDVPSPVNNKSLGLEVLRTMYPQQRGIATTAQDGDGGLSDIWTQARKFAAKLDIWGLWIDEAHDLANGGPKTLAVLQSTFKRWMSHGHRPILIISGTLAVDDILLTREIRRRFLAVESPILSADADTAELRRTIAVYLRASGLGIDGSLADFMPRLIHAGTRQIGWTIDVIIEAIREALLERSESLALRHFAQSYQAIVGCPEHENPFVAEDWSRIDTVLHRSSKAGAEPIKRRRRPRRDETLW
jgi:hypothetical protein